MTEGILSGLRVIEVSAFVAAPLAGATLASLGAEVIRIEQLGGGIDASRWPVHEGRSLYREGLDRGKRSVTLDLRSDRGRELATALITAPGRDAGIAITNLGTDGWMAYERLAELREDLIMVVIEGTSTGGAAVDYTVNAGAGFPWVTGPSDLPAPVNHVLPAWDVTAALYAVSGLLAAERHRRATGKGQLIRVALADVATAIAGHLGYLAEAALVDEPRGRFGNALYGSYGRDFRTLDGRHVMVLALTPRQWKALGEATGSAASFAAIEDRHGVRLSDEGARFEHRDEISAVIEPWIAGRPLEEVAGVFEEHGVLWGPYRTFKELVEAEPAARHQRASPIRYSSWNVADAPVSPALGDDTDAVLAEIGGVTADEFAVLRERGVL